MLDNMIISQIGYMCEKINQILFIPENIFIFIFNLYN